MQAKQKCPRADSNGRHKVKETGRGLSTTYHRVSVRAQTAGTVVHPARAVSPRIVWVAVSVGVRRVQGHADFPDYATGAQEA
jgi:hypothetical protein